TLNLERALAVSGWSVPARPCIELRHDALRRSEAYAFARFLRRAGFDTAVQGLNAGAGPELVGSAAPQASAEAERDIVLPGLGALTAHAPHIERAQVDALFAVFVRDRNVDIPRGVGAAAGEGGGRRDASE
ncbi:MAG: hypothetical protein OWT27_07675, partial [Firmicutes bacterium]|nr:hypothetical protein [Bacillota bacterium]